MDRLTELLNLLADTVRPSFANFGAVMALGPFRAISWEALQRLGMSDQNFGWTVEMQIKATIAKLRIREIPVRYRRRVGTSKISGTFNAGYKILYTIARYRWLTWWKS